MQTQTEIDFTLKPKRRPLVGIYQLRRDELWRHRREGRPIYHPRTCRAQILGLLADGEYHGFIRIADALDVGTYNLDGLLDRLEGWGYIEKRELYFHADPMFPHLPPKPYYGFQWGYRLKKK